MNIQAEDSQDTNLLNFIWRKTKTRASENMVLWLKCNFYKTSTGEMTQWSRAHVSFAVEQSLATL